MQMEQVISDIESTLANNGLVSDLVKKIMAAILPMLITLIEAELKKLFGVE